MLEKLESVEKRYEELNELLSQPDAAKDQDSFRRHAKEHSDLESVVGLYREWRQVGQELESNKELVKETDDAELRQLAQEEVSILRDRQDELHQALLLALLPKDPNDEKNIILELRAGTGGDEAALFAGNLFEAYCRYAEKKRWTVEIINRSESSVGGYKEVIARIVGKGAFSKFKYEKGVHRVQRVPVTETQGRVHTSTITVAVLPEAEEVEVEINEKDLRVDRFRSSGPGGQSVNTTDSAIRITHLPSGLVVTCQDEKSQLKNKNKAMTVLRARLFELEQAAADAELRDDRRSQIGTGDRSERIRTYNFPQGRVSDHRVNLTLYQLESVMQGELDQVIEPLTAHYRAKALEGVDDSS